MIPYQLIFRILYNMVNYAAARYHRHGVYKAAGLRFHVTIVFMSCCTVAFCFAIFVGCALTRQLWSDNTIWFHYRCNCENIEIFPLPWYLSIIRYYNYVGNGASVNVKCEKYDPWMGNTMLFWRSRKFEAYIRFQLSLIFM